MNVFNNVYLMGRLTADPNQRFLGDTTTAVVDFSLAVNRGYRSNNQDAPTADFIRCKAFGTTAENIAKFFKKGNRIAIWGNIQTGQYKNRDGQTVYTTEVVIDNWGFVDLKSESGNTAQASSAPAKRTTQRNDDFMNVPSGNDDDLPFN